MLSFQIFQEPQSLENKQKCLILTLVVDEDVVFIIDLKLKINRKLYG